MKIGKFSKNKKIVLRIFGVLSGLFGHASWKTKGLRKIRKKGEVVRSNKKVIADFSMANLEREVFPFKRTVSFIKPIF